MFKGRLNNMTVEKRMPGKGDNEYKNYLKSLEELYELAEKPVDPDSGLGLELLQNLKQLRDEIDPDEKDLNKFLDKLSEDQLKRLLLSGGGRVIDLSKYRKSKDPKVKTINLAQGDFNKTVAGLSDSDKDLIKQLLRKSGVLVGD